MIEAPRACFRFTTIIYPKYCPSERIVFFGGKPRSARVLSHADLYE
jgi:hypothetical protein